jgi:hypothetical protein
MNINDLVKAIRDKSNEEPVSNEDLDKVIKAVELSPCPFFTLEWQQIVKICNQAKLANEPKDAESDDDAERLGNSKINRRNFFVVEKMRETHPNRIAQLEKQWGEI